MTHDELLVKIDEVFGYQRFPKGILDITHNPPWNALRAVVELHKPVEFFRDFTLCGNCGSPNEYPCQTIQAIEKELK